ncbi:MAG: isoleucine--tRNA ligase [Gammaproteobacteria bacterium]|nr:isoleucine--tRNA ligase [Gammaproteobacteria bacterium]
MTTQTTKPDYKLNLPQTEFPMKANLAQREPEMLARWQQLDLYRLRQEQSVKHDKYIMHDGPPYANGAIHLGHAFNKIIKDIICKSHFLDGYATPFVPGWDCHGLPIEVNVEKNIGRAGDKVTAKQFRDACRDYAQQHVNNQSLDFQRLGILGDWQNPYLTMQKSYEANIVRALSKLVANDYLIQGFKPVFWCFACQSSLAEAEVEYQDKTSSAVDVKFTALDTEALEEKFDTDTTGFGGISIIIWTTTPWTLPANVALALNTEFDYVLVQVGDERWIVAETLLGQIMERYAIAHYEVLGRTRGENLENLKFQHPFYDRTSLSVLSDHVTADAGTGIVHIAPAYGEDDFRVGKKYDLPLESIVQANGTYVADLPLFGGENIFKANDKIVELLREKNKLVHDVKLQHSYPNCWRHKIPIIYRATPQWFITMKKLGDESIAVLPEVNWVPKWGQERLRLMIVNRPEWCISRQRAWGVPITIFINKETQAPHPRTVELMEDIAQRVEKNGIEAWFELDPKELLGGDAEHYTKITDVLDVWFESGVSHYCVLQQRPDLQYPADVYFEGSDQYRGWFQSSLLSSVAIDKKAPFKNLLSHGYTVDAQGRKMSKSLGNVISPDQVFNKEGADILRLWAASVDYTAEIVLTKEVLERTTDIYRRIRNTARFLLSNLNDFDPAKDQVIEKDMVKLDRWAVAYTQELQTKIIELYSKFDFHEAVQTIHNFCSGELGSFYLDIIKDRLYTCKVDGIARRSAQTAMYHILEAMVRWLAPILSFTADEIWQYMRGKRSASVHLERWYEGLEISADPEFNNEFWQTIIKFREDVNFHIEPKRASKEIGSSLEAKIYLNKPEHKAILDKFKIGDHNELRFALITSDATAELTEKNPGKLLDMSIEVKPSTNPKCARCWHRVPLAKDKEICERCVSNIEGAGEVRKFA